MNISTITGSTVHTDNITSFFAFALGLLGGSFVGIAIGDVDIASNMKGGLLTTYLTIVTALLSGGVGFVASRIGDRLTDRRATNRKINTAVMRIRFLAYELFKLTRLLDRMIAAKGPLDERTRGQFSARTTRIGLAASVLPDFDAIIEDDPDIFRALQATSTFLTIQSTFPAELPKDDKTAQALYVKMLHPVARAGIDGQREILMAVDRHFHTRIASR
jgi:hypothetical protein